MYIEFYKTAPLLPYKSHPYLSNLFFDERILIKLYLRLYKCMRYIYSIP